MVWFQRSYTVAAGNTSLVAPHEAEGLHYMENAIRRLINDLRPFRSDPPETQVSLVSRMESLNIPGLSFALTSDGVVVAAEGFGVTSTEGPSVMTSTLFQAASISKPIAALAALKLVEREKIALDTNIDEYLLRWKVRYSEPIQPTRVTIRQLLNHTAGLTIHGFSGYSSGMAAPNLIEILEGKSPSNTQPITVDASPGTMWRYSGGGYVVLQCLLEDVTGLAFSSIANELVLQPLRMTRSSFEQPLPDIHAGDVAMPHDTTGQLLIEGPHIYPEQAAAGLWTTPTDLAKCAIAISSGLDNASGGFLSTAMTRTMLTPGLGSWGLGLIVSESSTAGLQFGHNGANDGYRSWFWMYATGKGIFVLTNGDNGQQIAQELFEAARREFCWP